MTRVPDFDELLGPEVQGAERERLRRAHELLILAGPPPELAPDIEAGPAMRTTMLSERRKRRVRPMVLLAAALAVTVVAVVGLSGKSGTELGAYQLQGTALAPQAQGTLVLLREQGGNWPMRLQVSDLPALPAHSRYVVYLVRNGRRIAPCGSFVVTTPNSRLTLRFNAPYRIAHGDTWIVARDSGHGPEPTVMRPAQA